MSKPNKISQRWHLYVVSFSHITSFYAILPMIPFLNEQLELSGILYALSFSGYYITQLLSFLYFGSFSDRIGRRNTILIALFGLSICCLSNNFFINRYCTDISNDLNRTTYLAQLEAVVNAGQCIGPFVAGVISTQSVIYAIYFGIASDIFGFLYALFFLPESVESILEKRKLKRTFNMVKASNKRRLHQSLLSEANQEINALEKDFMETIKKEDARRRAGAKLEMNYLIVIAIVCEFCNKFIFSIFDTIVCQFGTEFHQMTSFEFSLLSTIGSAINIIQTGILFSWFINKCNFSIPSVGSWAGIVGAIACMVCIYGNKLVFDIGAILIIVGYGFYAPVAPSILSAESTDETHGKALSYVQIGSQLAYILSPVLLEHLYKKDQTLPFFITLVPAIILVLVMCICKYLPGGKMAGQISLEASLEHDAKMAFMKEDNEFESDFLGNTNFGMGNNDKQKKYRLSSSPANYISPNIHEMQAMSNGFTESVQTHILSRMDSNQYEEEMQI